MSRAATVAARTDPHETEPTAWSPSRVAGAAVLAAWAVLFWFLLVSGRVNLYLSTRTSWVVPIGAILLTLAAAGRLLAARVRRPDPLRRREAVVMTLMVLPVVIVLALPPATLGSSAASKKSTFTQSSIYGQITSTSEITLLSVAAAQTSNDGAAALAKRPGSEVDFVGFVTRNADTAADEFLLTRYVITCCVADATIVQVLVVNVVPGRFQPDQWVEVKGQIFGIGREVIVNPDSPDSIVSVPRPAKPYLTP